MELTLIEVQTNKWNPAMLAAAALFLGYKIQKQHMPLCIPFFPIQDNAFKEIVKGISLIVPWAHEKRSYRAVFKKYNLP